MIFLGNQAVGVTNSVLQDGYSVKVCTVETAIALGSDLASFIVSNIPDGYGVYGFCEVMIGDSGMTNQQLLLFEATVASGTVTGFFVRSGSGASVSIYSDFGNTYAVKAAVGQKIMMLYKEVS